MRTSTRFQASHPIFFCQFPQVKKADLDLEELGTRMRARMQELMGQVEEEEREST